MIQLYSTRTMSDQSIFVPKPFCTEDTLKRKRMLSENFKPLPDTVIIGKGHLPAKASGNKRLRALVEGLVDGYSNAKYRRDKTGIVLKILHSVQEACPEGAFVKKFDGQRWWEVSDSKAREKIASSFRDCLHDQYKSSTKNKMAKRRLLKALECARPTEINATKEASPTTCLSNCDIQSTKKRFTNSFLGLGFDDDDDKFHYLLDDEYPVGTFDPTIFDLPV